MNGSADVVIMGGGLAGLTLAIQLRQRLPTLDILVLERMRHPVTEAAHKVGESSVEIGAHYFDSVLGLKQHLTQQQLKKFGFRFFFSEGREEIDQVVELGASRYLATPSYQLDRGIFENFLAEHAQSMGIRFIDGASVSRITLAEEGAAASVHEIAYDREGGEHTVTAGWVCRRVGPRGPPQAQARSRRGERSRRQCHLVPHRRAHRPERVVHGSNLAHAL